MPIMSNSITYCAPAPQAFAANCSHRCTSTSSSSQQQQQFYQQTQKQPVNEQEQQHTTSLAINNFIKRKLHYKHNNEDLSCIDLPTMPQSMPTTPMQPLHMPEQQYSKCRTRSNYEQSYTNFDTESEQEHNIDDSASNLSINTSPPCTQGHAGSTYNCSNNFEPLNQLKRKWTKLQRHRHRRRHSNGSCGDAKELDKLVLQSVAFDDSDIY